MELRRSVKPSSLMSATSANEAPVRTTMCRNRDTLPVARANDRRVLQAYAPLDVKSSEGSTR